jgi:Family of unknown function (DUF6665)
MKMLQPSVFVLPSLVGGHVDRQEEPRQGWRIARETYTVHCGISVGSSSNRVVVMSLRMPGTLSFPSDTMKGQDALEYEIRQEQAATIGRLARELRDALDALDTYSREASSGKTAADSRDPKRARLVDAAAYALWNFVVQRECSGFSGTEHLLKDYAVSVEVRAQMGVIRPR